MLRSKTSGKWCITGLNGDKFWTAADISNVAGVELIIDKKLKWKKNIDQVLTNYCWQRYVGNCAGIQLSRKHGSLGTRIAFAHINANKAAYYGCLGNITRNPKQAYQNYNYLKLFHQRFFF